MCYLCSQLSANGYEEAALGSSLYWGKNEGKPGDGTDADDDLSFLDHSFIPSIVTQVAASGNVLTDALIWGWKWSYPNWSYSFPQDSSEYDHPAFGEEDGFPGYGYGSVIGFQGFNDQQQDQIASVIGNIETFLPVLFLPAEKVSEEDFGEEEFFVDFRFAIAEGISYGYGTNGLGQEYVVHGPGGGGSAEAAVPDPFMMNWRSMGDTWFISDVYDEPIPGSFSAAAGLMHEFGHTLGLKHGHHPQEVFHIGDHYVDENGFLFAKPDHVGNAPALPYEFDSQEYSIMTYRTYVGNEPFVPGPNDLPLLMVDYPWSFMMLDIATLQYLYGANFGEGSNPGDTTYSFDPETGQMRVNDTIDGEHVTAPSLRGKVFLTIWDGGGENTYDFSNYAEDMQIDLRPGEWITFSPSQLAQLGKGIHAKGNIANALLYEGDTRSLVANVIAGKGDHVIIGNDADNYIFANDGNSRIFGSAGNDLIEGGEGRDTVLYWDDREFFDIALLEEGAISVAKSNGLDTLVTIERIEFSDGALLLDLESVNLGFTYRLYGSAFGRVPDEDGLRFWVDLLDNLEKPLSLPTLAMSFLGADEFRALYGDDLSNSSYVEGLYANILDRAPEEAGLVYWKGALEEGLTRSDLLAHFAESAESVARTESDLSLGVWVA